LGPQVDGGDRAGDGHPLVWMTWPAPKAAVMAARSSFSRGSLPGRLTVVLGLGGALVARASPPTVAATATVTRARSSACWRHSRRNRRADHRMMARRAAAPPFPRPPYA